MSGAFTTMMIWFAQAGVRNIKIRRAFRNAWTLSALLFFLIIGLTIRYASIAYSSIHGAEIVVPSTVNEMLGPLYYVLPIFAVLIAWNPLFRVFRIYKIALATLSATFVFTLAFFYLIQPPIDLNAVYAHRYADQIHFMEQTFERAETEYGITFSEADRKTLSMTIWSDDRKVTEDALVELVLSDRRMTLDSAIMLETVLLKSNHGLMSQPMNRYLTESGIIALRLVRKYRMTDSSEVDLRTELRYMVKEEWMIENLREKTEEIIGGRNTSEGSSSSTDMETWEEYLSWFNETYNDSIRSDAEYERVEPYNILIDFDILGNPILETYGHSPKYKGEMDNYMRLGPLFP
ncbi:hypothetical protein [Phaeocystidibacter luteus]|uniref:Uncharacterized protein n=1 Tax=Phaeocystidibacter luteus TaxID=911197 RepID=A0A6N6RH89_9FLAO|nr:hypothetical protein [Phaeocystidibacter luteus]KAB2808632.1 hypothetical protein F8C67_10115 [Phaeocystidibacter luteus]